MTQNEKILWIAAISPFARELFYYYKGKRDAKRALIIKPPKDPKTMLLYKLLFAAGHTYAKLKSKALA